MRSRAQLAPLAILAVLAVACGRDAGTLASDSINAAARPVGSSPAPSGSSATGVTPACPATGAWAPCSIVQRLDRAGLVPRIDSASATEPLLTAPGLLVRLGRGELEVYLYADVATRERDQGRLDRARYLEYTAPITMESLPTLIASANALVIMHSRNDHQRERVGDAITAGPPSRPQ